MISMNKLLELDSPETEDKMIDYLFEKIDNQLFKKDHDPIHRFLKEINVDKISIQLGVSILSITKPLRNCDSRIIFCSKFKEKLKKTKSKEQIERLLNNLDL